MGDTFAGKTAIDEITGQQISGTFLGYEYDRVTFPIDDNMDSLDHTAVGSALSNQVDHVCHTGFARSGVARLIIRVAKSAITEVFLLTSSTRFEFTPFFSPLKIHK